MKRVLSLLLVFFIIFNTITPSMAVTNMYNVSVTKSMVNIELSEESDEGNEEVTLTANSTEDFYLPYHSGYTLLKNGRLKTFSDKNRIISEKIYVEENKIYHFKNLSAKYGNCFYVIYNSDNEAISYLRATEESTGEVLENINVIMPEKASYFRVACDLNVNNKMFEASKSYTGSNAKRTEPAIISFIDDDCRQEVFQDLYPLIKEIEGELGIKIPYTLACPPDNLEVSDELNEEIDKKRKYLTTKQLDVLHKDEDEDDKVDMDIEIVSHHLVETKMTDFDSMEAYEKDTKACLEKFKDMGIEVSGVAYPNGAINEEYMSVVEENFKLGFTTDRGINTLPYESYYIDRHELFPTSGIYDTDYAEELVNSVAENGGWLVFMTHCWYDTFPKISILKDPNATEEEKLVELEKIEKVKTLFKKIKENNIEILSVTDVIDKYSNPIEIGVVKKPLTEMTEDFFVLDCKGRAYTNNVEMTNFETNNMTIIEKSAIKWDELSIDYNVGVTLKTDGDEVGYFEAESPLSEKQISQRKRNVSTDIPVTPYTTYKLTNMAAKYGKCFYVIYDSEHKVIKYQETSESSTGERLDELIITMPSNAAYLKMSCDLNLNNKMFKIYRASLISGWEELVTEKLDSSYSSSFTLLESGNIKEFSDQNRIISKEIQVDHNSVYCFKNLSAKYGNCFYVIYDSDYNVLDFRKTSESSIGETLDEIIVAMPSNAKYLRVACDLDVNNEMFTVYRESIKDKVITFDANGGKCIVSSIYTDGKLETIPVATREGYEFFGWYTEKTGGKRMLTEVPSKTNTTVYAKWVKERRKIGIGLFMNLLGGSKANNTD